MYDPSNPHHQSLYPNGRWGAYWMREFNTYLSIDRTTYNGMFPPTEDRPDGSMCHQNRGDGIALPIQANGKSEPVVTLCTEDGGYYRPIQFDWHVLPSRFYPPFSEQGLPYSQLPKNDPQQLWDTLAWTVIHEMLHILGPVREWVALIVCS